MSVAPGIVLVVAKSARLLACYLADAGYEVVAVDCFGDLDTRETVLDFRRVGGLALRDIKAPVNELIERYRPTHALYGSGFERHVDSLVFLHRRLALLGNTPAVFAAVQNKPGFFRALDELGVEYPEVSFDAPPKGCGWLLKPHAGEGGWGIESYRPGADHAGEACYWQRHVEGEPMSVLFVAAESDAVVVGYQRQRAAPCGEPMRFLFAGVDSRAELPTAVRDELARLVRALVARYGLRGLNGLDFIHAGECCYPLEINARPTASLQLYGTDVIEAHIQAVLNGELSRMERIEDDYVSLRILYAPVVITIPAGMVWPDWTADRPAQGSAIGQGEPVCSIIARAKTRQRLEHELRNRRQIIEKLFNYR